MDMITAKIDVEKIEDRHLFKGRKGLYADLVLIPSPNNQYGDDYMVVQGIDKVRRDAGERGPILGNAKILRRDQSREETSDQKREPEPEREREPTETQEDIPF